MRHAIHRAVAVAIAATALCTATACHHHRHRHEGPAQHVGRHVDHGLDKAGDAVENAGRAVNRALPGD